MSADVSRETQLIPAAPGKPAVLVALERIEEKLDELLADSRQARPLLERYLKVSGAPWARAGKRGPR